MIITTPEELRLFSPSNAVDNIESLTGFINSSEHDFLRDKLGNSLYASLVAYYNKTVRNNLDGYLSMMQDPAALQPYASLLYLCQKVVTYDALSRAVSLQAVSINGMGVNVAATDNYKAADREAIADFRKGCIKEAHSAVNALLQTLEDWAMAVAGPESEDDGETLPDSDTDIDDRDQEESKISLASEEDIEEEDSAGEAVDLMEEKREIVTLWKTSRYFYLVTTLLIPSAVVLQEYYNIYDSREKYIQMVPDLRYVQEDIIAPIFGEELIEYFAALPWESGQIMDRHTLHILHNLRKIMARYLEIRLIKSTDERHTEARNEAVKLTNRLVEYFHIHQQDLSEKLLDVFKVSPLYEAPSEDDMTVSDNAPLFRNNSSGAVMFVTPGLL